MPNAGEDIYRHNRSNHKRIHTVYTGTFKLLLKIFISLIFCFLIHLLPLYAQSYFEFEQKKADSLTGVLPALRGREKIDALNELAGLHTRHYPEKSITLAEEALRLSKEESYSHGEAVANLVLGTVHYYRSSFVRSTNYLLDAYKIFKETGPSKELAKCSYLLAYNLYISGTDKTSGYYMRDAIRIFNETGLKFEEALAILHLSVVMRWEKRYEEALQMNAEACSLLITKGIGRSIDKGIAIACRGDIVRDTGNLRAAINYYLQGASYYDTTRIEDLALKAQNLGTLGTDYMNFGKNDSALYYYQQSLNIARSIGSIFSMPRQFSRLAGYALARGDTALAIIQYNSALYYLNIADSLGYYYLNEKYSHYVSYSFELYYPTPVRERRNNIHLWKLKVYHALSSIYRSRGDLEQVLEIHEKTDALKDSIYRFNRNTEMKEIAARYETEEKDRQIELLSKENELRNLQVRQSRFFLFGMVGLAVFIIVFAIFIVRQNRLKSEQQNVLIRQKLLRSQMNPHFIFNSLASIQNTIISNNPEKATRYLARFSKLVRNILDSSVEELIPLEEEISTIENYLELQKFRYPDKFDFKIEIDPELDTDSLLIPAMLVQPFIENSIEHGVKHKEGKGNIRVRFKKKDDLLVIEVEDDGIGREKAQELLMEQEKDHKSLSTGIILERLKVLNRKRKRKITIEITDLVDSNGNPLGTLVRTTIPV